MLYCRKGLFGVTVNIASNGRAQIVKVLPKSCARKFGVRPLWELLKINDEKPTWENEKQAEAAINNEKFEWPVTFVWNAAQGVAPDDEEEEEEEELEVNWEEG
jgi:hypothetical protein